MRFFRKCCVSVLSIALGLAVLIQPASGYTVYAQTVDSINSTSGALPDSSNGGSGSSGEGVAGLDVRGEAPMGAGGASSDQSVGNVDQKGFGTGANADGLSSDSASAQDDTTASVEAAPDGGGSVQQPRGDQENLPVLSYSAHVQDIGWQASVTDGITAGTTGESKHMEALRVNLADYPQDAIQVQSHIQDIGWPADDSWVGNGEQAGTTGKSKSLEAVRIRLSSSLSDRYSVWYQVHVSNIGWMGWTCDGQEAGTTGYGYGIEAIRITILPKGDAAPGSTDCPYRNHADDPAQVIYSAHVSEIGWQGSVAGPATAGTTGRGLSIEALQTSLDWYGHSGSIQMRAHVQDDGWGSWTTGTVGTTGRSKRIEAIQMKLDGEAGQTYDIWYRVHSAELGWLGWTSNGKVAGSTGLSHGIQAVQIMLVPKAGGTPPESSGEAYIGAEETLQGRALLPGGASQTSSNDEQVIIGNENQGNVLHSISIQVNNQICEGTISYQGLYRGSSDWSGMASDGVQIDSSNSGAPLKAVRISLGGGLADKYDLWYQVYDSERGWLGWACNGAAAGVSPDAVSSVCAVQVELVAKGGNAPGSIEDSYIQTAGANLPTIIGQAHSAEVGWQSPTSAQEGQSIILGTTGKSLSLQAVRLGLAGPVSGSIEINAHVAEKGWQGYIDESTDPLAFSGTVGENLPIQAIRIKLEGDIAGNYDIYYRVHAANYGWLGWAKNDEEAGTTGLALQAEAIEIRLVPKGSSDSVPDSSNEPSLVTMPGLSLETHVQDLGWQPAVGSGGVSGTTGQARRIEAMRLNISSSNISGGIAYSAYIQDIGWQNEVSNGQIAGTTGQGRRVEAIKIRLTGDLSRYFDIWYRAYVQDYGWLGWASNGGQAGTGKISYRMEAVQIKLQPKGSAAPGSTYGPYTEIPLLPADQLAMLNRANWYSSSTNWLLLVNLSSCKVGVYQGGRGSWQQVFYWDCGPGKPSTPTVTGEFTVTGKGYSFGHGYTCYYYTQFYGDYLFHSIKYYQGTFNVMDGRLGVQVSNGCVRLALQNAKWLYENIPYGTKVVIFR